MDKITKKIQKISGETEPITVSIIDLEPPTVHGMIAVQARINIHKSLYEVVSQIALSLEGDTRRLLEIVLTGLIQDGQMRNKEGACSDK